MYLGWYSDNPKLTTEQKIAAGIAAFETRYGTRPTVVLVNEAELVQVPGVLVKSDPYTRRNNYGIGMVQA